MCPLPSLPHLPSIVVPSCTHFLPVPGRVEGGVNDSETLATGSLTRLRTGSLYTINGKCHKEPETEHRRLKDYFSVSVGCKRTGRNIKTSWYVTKFSFDGFYTGISDRSDNMKTRIPLESSVLRFRTDNRFFTGRICYLLMSSYTNYTK